MVAAGAIVDLPELGGSARLREAGLISIGNSPAEFASLLPDQAARWQSIVKTLGLKFN